MKLIRFAVDNFGGINGGLENNSINFESSSAIFIFGQNNVGKSTFLRAYKAFYEDSIDEGDFTESNGNDIVIEIWLKINEAKDKTIIDQGTGNKFVHLKENYLDNNILKLRKTWKRSDNGKTKINETLSNHGIWEDISYGGIGLHGVLKPLMMQPLLIKAMPEESEVEEIVNTILKEAASKKLSIQENKDLEKAEQAISKLQDKIYDKSIIENYRKKVNERFKTLFPSYEVGIDDGKSRLKYTHDKLGKDFKITFNRLNSNQVSSYLQMGHGAVRMAIFLLMLMRDELREGGLAEKNFLVLFEEPELFLHPVLTKKLRSLIYEVSKDDMPFQILSASHSPQMIDISKDHTSLVRMIKNDDLTTCLFQVNKNDLKNNEQTTIEDVKNKIYEILRFDPFICESFYADEVALVEGDTEAIIWRGYQQEFSQKKDIFVVNCHSCVNIPFYQKIFSKFDIPYSVICDTDHIKSLSTDNLTGWDMKVQFPKFRSGIQKTIAEQFYKDKTEQRAKHFLVFPQTFEPCHKQLHEPFKFENLPSEGKPFNADKYWKKISKYKNEEGFEEVPIISYIKTILND